MTTNRLKMCPAMAVRAWMQEMLANDGKLASCAAGGEVGANAGAAKGSNEGKVGGFKDIMGGSTGGISDLKGVP